MKKIMRLGPYKWDASELVTAIGSVWAETQEEMDANMDWSSIATDADTEALTTTVPPTKTINMR